jgi:hypothetical protein
LLISSLNLTISAWCTLFTEHRADFFSDPDSHNVLTVLSRPCLWALVGENSSLLASPHLPGHHTSSFPALFGQAYGIYRTPFILQSQTVLRRCDLWTVPPLGQVLSSHEYVALPVIHHQRYRTMFETPTHRQNRRSLQNQRVWRVKYQSQNPLKKSNEGGIGL